MTRAVTDTITADYERQRAHTTIEMRVVEKLARRAVLSVPGVIEHSSGLGQFAGRKFPRIDARMISGDKAVAVEVQIATRWPAPTVAVAQVARETVAEWISHATGVPVASVNVNVGAVVPHPHLSPEESRIGIAELVATPRTPELTRVTATPLTATHPTVTRRHAELVHPAAQETVELDPVVAGRPVEPRSVPAPTSLTVTATSPRLPERPALVPVEAPRPIQVTHPRDPAPVTVTYPVAPHSRNNPPVTVRPHTNHSPAVSPPPQYGLRLLADVPTPQPPALRTVPTPRGLPTRAVPTPQGLPVSIHPLVRRTGLTPVTVNRHARITPTAPRDARGPGDTVDTVDTDTEEGRGQ